MFVVFVILNVLGVSCNIQVNQKALKPFEDYYKEDSLVSCVLHILNKYYVNEKLLTFVDMSQNDDRLLRAVHALTPLNVVYRQPISEPFSYNQGYLVTASNVADFKENFLHITQEPSWNPYAKFLIVIKWMKEVDLRQIFNILMKYHVLNVLVVNETEPILCTYNPYEDYACGKYYNRIINFGYCPKTVDLYPHKFITGMRRCTLTIMVPHWPPYTMNPAKIKHGMLEFGLEQSIMSIIGEREQFNISYIYKDNGEEYTKISHEMAASGPFEMLQNNETDLMMGGLLLTPLRAAAFAYTSSHLDLADDIRIIVKKAMNQPVWKNIYLEFEPTVWLLLLICFLLFGTLMIVLLRIRDKSHFLLLLSDTLLQHGRKFRCKWSGKCIFIFWIWFAYLMNCFYQSSLSSLTTKPGHERQISDMEDIRLYNVKPCLSLVMTQLLSDINIIFPLLNDTDCHSFSDSIKTVSETDNTYSIILYSVYFYQKDKFYDEYGNNLIYSFKDAIFQASYAVFMSKGFPLKERLNILMIRLRETGLVQEHYKHQYDMLKLVNRFKHKEFRARFVAPWYLYAGGIGLSIFVFLVEVSVKLKV